MYVRVKVGSRYRSRGVCESERAIEKRVRNFNLETPGIGQKLITYDPAGASVR